MNKRILFTALILYPMLGHTQQSERPLPPGINQPSVNLFAPYVSGDGKTLVYLSDYADDGHHIMYWSTREGREWNEGKEVNKLINRPTHNLRGGFALNYDGDQLFFTSRKSGLGGYDIWLSERAGNDWKAPKNLGAPLNSSEDEGAPSLTADGNTMYLMRCDQMFEYKVAQGCRIMVSQKIRGKWQAPEPLPENINTGNSQMPRILGDDLTLLFASDRPGGKGGLDIYMSRKEDDTWTDPVPVKDLNGPDHDAFVSASAKGRYIFRSVKGARNRVLVETLLPKEAQSIRVHRINGTFTGPVSAQLLVFNTDSRGRHTNISLEPGEDFSLVLKEGPWYDISIAGKTPGYGYYARLMDLEKVGRIDRETITVGLNPLHAGDTISAQIKFDGDQCQWSDHFEYEARRLGYLLRDNPDIHVDFTVLNPAYREDSIASPELTQVRYDTLYSPQTDSLKIFPDPLKTQDRRLYTYGDSLLIVNPQLDSTVIALSDITVDTIFHNDQTNSEAEQLKYYMIERGVDTTQFTISTKLQPVLTDKAPRYSSEDIPMEKEEPVNDKIIAVLRE